MSCKSLLSCKLHQCRVNRFYLVKSLLSCELHLLCKQLLSCKSLLSCKRHLSCKQLLSCKSLLSCELLLSCKSLLSCKLLMLCKSRLRHGVKVQVACHLYMCNNEQYTIKLVNVLFYFFSRRKRHTHTHTKKKTKKCFNVFIILTYPQDYLHDKKFNYINLPTVLCTINLTTEIIT